MERKKESKKVESSIPVGSYKRPKSFQTVLFTLVFFFFFFFFFFFLFFFFFFFFFFFKLVSLHRCICMNSCNSCTVLSNLILSFLFCIWRKDYIFKGSHFVKISFVSHLKLGLQLQQLYCVIQSDLVLSVLRLKEGLHFQGKSLCQNLFCLPSEIGSTFKGKKTCLLTENIPIGVDHFCSTGLVFRWTNRQSKKLSPFLRNDGKTIKCTKSP